VNSEHNMNDTITKSYYTIGEVSKMLNLPISLIRFWETEIAIFNPEKTEKGTRKFSQKDIQTLRLIHHLVKEKGFTLQGANEKLKHDAQLDANAQLIDSLKRVREFLQSIKSELK